MKFMTKKALLCLAITCAISNNAHSDLAENVAENMRGIATALNNTDANANEIYWLRKDVVKNTNASAANTEAVSRGAAVIEDHETRITDNNNDNRLQDNWIAIVDERSQFANNKATENTNKLKEYDDAVVSVEDVKINVAAHTEEISKNQINIQNNVNAAVNNANSIANNSSSIANNSSSIANNREESNSGIAIALSNNVILPALDKKFSFSISVAEYQGSSALGFSGAGRVNSSTSLFFGFGTDSTGDYTASKIGANFQW